MKKYLCLFLCWIWLSISQSFAQDTKLRTDSKITFTNETTKRELNVISGKNVATMKIFVRSKLQKGKVTIQILDPNGEEEGIFSVVSLIIEDDSSGKTEETVHGEIRKELKKPSIGEWQIKIEAIEATGAVDISVLQYH